MSKLTSILASKKIQNVPAHPDFPSKVKPDGLVCKSAKECGQCPFSSSHKTYESGHLTQPLAQHHRMNLKLLRSLQWYIHRIANDLRLMEGSQPGYLINSEVAYNFCDARHFEIVSASGNQMTLKTLDEDTDPRDVVIYGYRVNAEAFVSMHKVSSEIRGRLQAGDKVVFSYPSVLERKCKPTIKRIVACDPEARTVTVELDKSVDGYDWISDATLSEFPEKWYCSVWRYNAPEQWQPVIDWDHFPAVRKSIILNAQQVSSTGNTLKDSAGNDTCIADYYEAPEPYYEDDTTFQVWGLKDGEWHNLTSQCLGRYRVETFNTSPPTYRATVYLGDKIWPNDEHPGGQPVNDLRTEYSLFRIVYFPRATETEINRDKAMAVGQHGCKWSRADHSGSAGNYAMPNGVGVSGGKHHECIKRRYRKETKVYDDDPESETYGDQIGIDYTYEQPSGIENYPEDGRCMQCNSCDLYEPMMSDSSVDVENAPFSGWFSWGRFYKQITAGQDIYIKQLMPGGSGHRNWVVGRRNNPSLRSLHGDYSLTSDSGMHELWLWITSGMVGEVETYTEQEVINEGTPEERTLNHTRLRYKRTGAHWDTSHDVSEADFDDPSTYPGPGHLPVHVADYTTKHDLINYTSSIPSGLPMSNPYCSLRLYDERSGYMNTLDSGEIIGRGVHQYAHVVPANEPLYVPRVDLEETEKDQDLGQFVFRAYEETQSRQGKDIAAVLKVKPMTDPMKQSHSPVSGIIHSVTSLGNNRYKIELENGPHQTSVIDGPSLFRYDRIISWRAGGSFVRLPKICYPNSYYETNKAVGGQADLCMPGDSITIGYNLDGIDLSETPLMVVSASACAGSTDPSWGNEHVIRTFIALGYWQADAAFMFYKNESLIGDIHSSLTVPTVVTPFDHAAGGSQIWVQPAVPLTNQVKLKNKRTGEQVYVVNWEGYDEDSPQFGGLCTLNSNLVQDVEAGDEWEWLTVTNVNNPYQPLTAIPSGPNESRPATIPANSYWVDPDNNRIIFGPGTKTTHPVVNIQYTGSYKGVATSDVLVGSYNVEDYGLFNLGVSAAQVSGKPVVCKYANGGALTKVTDNPAKGQYALIEQDGVIWIKTNLEDAGVVMVIDWDLQQELADPGQVVSMPNYGSWARRRDVIEVIDESGKIEASISALTGSAITCWWNKGPVWYPDGQQLEVAQFQTDEFTPATASELIMEHGTGNIFITATLLNQWRSAYGRFVCFRL